MLNSKKPWNKLSHEQYVDQLNEGHGGDFKLLSEYVNSTIKIHVRHKCGYTFWVAPHSLKSSPKGKGCRKCAGKVPFDSHEDYIAAVVTKFTELNLDPFKIKFLTKYEKVSKKMEMECTDCGYTFERLPDVHLRGHLCAMCSGSAQKDSKTFIEHAKKKRDDFDDFDLSPVDYQNCKEKVIIIHKVCGTRLSVTPDHFLNKTDSTFCPTCNKYGVNTHEDFLRMSRETHGEGYEYLSQYKTCKEKVWMRHKKCGHVFPQEAYSHYGFGCGCPKCDPSGHTLPLEERHQRWLINSNKKHLNFYENGYSLTDPSLPNGYKNSQTPVTIICPRHGPWHTTTPASHVQGAGCPICKASRAEKEIGRILIENDIKFEREKKFKTCKHQHCLPFDFYLPDLALLIEYDGEQHFIPMRFLNKVKGQKKLKELQARDKIKTKWATSSPYTLHRIIYNQDIKERMNEILKNSSKVVAPQKPHQKFSQLEFDI